MTRTGVHQPRVTTLTGRPVDLEMQALPGPGDYAPEDVRSDTGSGEAAPSFTMRQRTSIKPLQPNPGPNVYRIPGTVGGAVPSGITRMPHVSISGRDERGGFADDTRKTPGPGRYGHSKDKSYRKLTSPSYSMTANHHLPSDQSRKPGPGAHSPEKVNLSKKSPGYSMGRRWSDSVAPFV